MIGPADPYPDILEAVMRARIAGDIEAVSGLFEGIRFEAPGPRDKRWPSVPEIARIYARDKYTCRYCGERVILTPVMRLISCLHPEQFPFHKNWKTELTHPAFISRSATLDHVQAVSAGGDPIGHANLVTACWGCNRRKADLPLVVLGWQVLPIADTDWQGLTDLYRPLWEAAGKPELTAGDHAWMRAAEQASGES